MAGVGGEEAVELFLLGFWSDRSSAGRYRLVPPWESCPPQPTGGRVAVASEDATTSLPAPTLIVGEKTSLPEVEKLTLTMLRRGECVASIPLVAVISNEDGGKVALPANISIQIHPIEGRAIVRVYENEGSEVKWKSTGLYTLYAISAEDMKSTTATMKTGHMYYPSAEQVFGKKTIDFHAQGFLDIPFPPLNMIFEMDFQCEKRIGSGTEGIVYKCLSRFSLHYSAIKEIVPEYVLVRSIHCEPREVSLLVMLNHENVVKFYLAWSETKKSIYGRCPMAIYGLGRMTNTTFLSMQLCARSLMEYLNESPDVDLESRRYIFKQLIAGLEYMHQHGVVHRDIKPGNVLLEEYLRVKIADLGIAKRKQPSNNITSVGGIYGSLPYRAPELIDIYKHHDGKVDIFSVGMIYFEMFTPGVKKREKKLSLLSRRIRQGMQECDQQMIPFDLDTVLEGTDVLEGWKGNYDILKTMIRPNCNQRPSATEIMGLFDNQEGVGLELEGH